MSRSVLVTTRTWGVTLVLLTVLFLSSCATVREALQIQKPKIRFENAHITGVSFDAVDLAVDLEVGNPNPLPVAMTGFDYELKINDVSFLTGQQDQSLTIAAMEKSAIQIPVSLHYKDLYETFKSLRLKDATAYQVAGGVSFDLPVLGLARIPFRVGGEVPAVKIPGVEIQGLKVNKIDFAGADVELRINLQNFNAFELLLNNFDYELAINGNTWARGVETQAVRFSEKSQTSFGIPISLDFAQIGLTAYQLLAGKREVTYQFRGSLDFGSSFPFFKHATLPLNRSGILSIFR